MKEEKIGIKWGWVIKCDSHLCNMIGGCMASLNFAWATHSWWLGWHHFGDIDG